MEKLSWELKRWNELWKKHETELKINRSNGFTDDAVNSREASGLNMETAESLWTNHS